MTTAMILKINLGILLSKPKPMTLLVCDLRLSKEKTEILGCWLQQWNLLASGTKTSTFSNHSKLLSAFYEKRNSLCVCVWRVRAHSQNINGLMHELGFQHNPHHWSLSQTHQKSV
jgi:hypothetical protein